MDTADHEFTSFVAAAWPGLVRTALLLTGDLARAEDLAQGALVRTHRRWSSLRRKDRPDVYVRRVMLNLHRSWWRRHRGREHLMAEPPDRSTGAGWPGSDADDRDAALAEALAGLPTRMRATLVLRFYDDLSEQQTAEILGCSVGTVKSQTSRGLDRLRQALAATGTEPAEVPTTREA